MSLKQGSATKVLLSLTFAAVLSGCVAEKVAPTVRPGSVDEVRPMLQDFTINLASAVFIARSCHSTGIRLVYMDPRYAIEKFVRDRMAEGYTEAEIKGALDSLSAEQTAAKGIQKLKAKGIREGDLESVCRVGKAEIKARTPIGQFLKDQA